MIWTCASVNWIAGWALVMASFISGAGLGLFFHRDDFWGGYGSFRRRIVRLGHIALAQLGMLNILFALSPWTRADSPLIRWASGLLLAGSIAMPAVCFLTGWKKPFRHLFPVPVSLLITAVALTLYGALT